MAINPKDFMSTQTGGEGSTIQAEIETATPDQFKANISPIQQKEQVVEVPAAVDIPVANVPDVTVAEEQIQQPITLTEEEKIYSDLGLLKSEVDIPEQLNNIDARIVEDEITEPNISTVSENMYTEDGDVIMSASALYSGLKNTEEVDSSIDESIYNDAEEASDISLNYKTEDGLNIYSPSAESNKENKKTQNEYSNIGINIDDTGRVEVKKPTDNVYPRYKLPDTGIMYEKRPDGWYKDDGKGNYVKIKKGNVAQRSAYLDKNAVLVSSLGTGTKSTSDAAKIVNERVGSLKSSDINNVLTSGGDPTISDGLSFNQLTRSNIGKSNEKYNQDGSLNFNYNPKYDNVPREAQGLLDFSGKPDGVYVYPDNDASYKKENGNWYKKPKGSSDYFQIKGEGAEQRIHNLEMKAVPSFKLKEASALINNKALLGSTKNITQEYDLMNKVLFGGDGSKIGRYEESFEDAKNFASKDVNLLLKDDMTLEQRQGIIDYQKRLNEVLVDGEYSLDKAIKTSQILKEAEQFFQTSKDINKSINEANQAGVSMARMSFENKKKTFQDTFLTGNVTSDFQKDAFDLFVATGSLADFFIENTDNGKIRFDANSGQYVISKDISDVERRYIDGKLTQFVNQYNELQNKKFSEVNDKISTYKRSLSNINSNISKIEGSLQGMRDSGVKVNDPAYVALSSQLDKEKKKAEYLNGAISETEKVKGAAFLTEPKKIAKDAANNLSQDAKNIFKAIPQSVAPKQRFDLFYEKLQKETAQFKKDNGISDSRISGMNMALKDLLDWDGFYALNDAEKRYAQNVATLRQLAPLYYNNDFGITQDSAGFWESFSNSFQQALFPNIAAASGRTVQTTSAGKILEVAAEEGYSEEDFIDSDALDKLRDRAIVGLDTMEKWGSMLGSTAGIIVPLMVTKKLPSTALRVASNLERVIIGAKTASDANKTVGLIANAEKIYDAVLSSNKIGRFLRPAVESGVRFETAGTVFNQEELSFLSGLAGGVASEALSGILSKIPKEQVYGYLSSVFGSQTNRAVNVIKSIADASARGIAETGEEFSQEMSNIYRETDNFKDMMDELSSRFGTFDQVQEFIISSFILGAAFGIVDSNQGKDVLAKLPEKKRNQVNQALSEVNSSLLQADNAVDEYVENKLTQEGINKSVEEYDKKDEQGVSGKVGEGEKPIETQPIAEAGQEATSPSGVVQEEQTGVAEPIEERITATTAEEAKALWDQGYRPSVEGAEVRGGKDMAINNLFNTRKQVDMVRMVTPEAQVDTEAQVTPNAEVEQKGYEKLAEKIRSGKIDTRGLGMLGLIPPQVLNASLEGVALTVETVGQVIEKIKESDWYKSLSESSKPIIEREINRSLNNLTSKTTYTEQDALNEAYTTEFSDVYNNLISEVDRNPNAANVNNLKAFTDNPKQFIQDLVDTGEIKSDVYYGINIDSRDNNKSTEEYISDRMAKVDSSISSDAKSNANNIIAQQQQSKTNTDAPFMMSESISITSDIEKAKADGVTDEEINEAQEYLDDPIKYHKEMYDLFGDPNTRYYDEERAQKSLRELNYVKSVYERYGVELKRKRTLKDINKKVSEKRTLYSKSGNKWVGKVSVEAQKEFIDFINSPALDGLDNRTQEELDAINDILDGIISEGKTDYGAVKRLEQKAKRERAAQIISGLARGEEVTLNGIDKVNEWLDAGNLVVINGQLFRKSDLKELENQKKILKRKKKAREKELEALNQDLISDDELAVIDASINSIYNEIEDAKDQISELERAIAETSIDKDISFTGYKQRDLKAVRNANIADRKKWYKPRNWVRALNPTNAINDVYSLLKSAYSGSSAVTKFIKNNLEKPIQKAYFERQKAYQEKVASYYKEVGAIFGSSKKALSYLSSTPDVNPRTDKYVAENLPLSNGHMVDWYNLIRANENGVDRMNKSDINAQAVISYIESDAKLKAYADYLLNEYNTKLRSEYEPVHQGYTNTPFGDGTYYPSYASGFEQNFISEDQIMGADDMYNSMNATSRNLKQRVNYSGPFDTSLDAHAKFLDYIKTMEHAKNFMPIAKSVNELFSKANAPYLIENMGIANFSDLKIHLGVILGDKPLSEFKGGFGKFASAFKNLSVVTTLSLRPASIVKQWTSFTHYWIAGISEGVDPQKVLTAVPKNKQEWDFFSYLYTSPYIKERFKGEGIDIELKRLAQEAERSKSAEAFEQLTKYAMLPVRLGDISAVLFGLGGGTQFALALYKKGRAEGMTDAEARDYAYEKFVTETERAQQSTREDITSNIQRDPAFRLMAMYRTGQMSATKKVVNGIKTIYQAHQIQMNEGVDARQNVISERELAQAISDIVYFTTFGSVFFNAIASGSLMYILASDTSDDEEKRMLYDAAMDQIQSNLQGYGWQGFIGDWVMNYARGNEWMNNIPVLKFMNAVYKTPTTAIKAALREWPTLTKEQKIEYLKNNDLAREITGENQEQQLIDFMDAYADGSFWSKMTDAERIEFIKAIGAGNASKFIKAMGETIDGNKSMFEAIMSYDENYFEQDKKSGRRDVIYELIYGEPYLIKDEENKIKGGSPFPEPIEDIELEENLEEKLD